jgi:hypothetical protein
MQHVGSSCLQYTAWCLRCPTTVQTTSCFKAHDLQLIRHYRRTQLPQFNRSSTPVVPEITQELPNPELTIVVDNSSCPQGAENKRTDIRLRKQTTQHAAVVRNESVALLAVSN